TLRKSVMCRAPAHSAGSMRPSMSTAKAGRQATSHIPASQQAPRWFKRAIPVIMTRILARPRAVIDCRRSWQPSVAGRHRLSARSRRRSPSALGLQHGPRAVLRTAPAGPDLLVLGVVRLVEDDAIVVGQLLAGLDVAQRHHVDLVL